MSKSDRAGLQHSGTTDASTTTTEYNNWSATCTCGWTTSVHYRSRDRAAYSAEHHQEYCPEGGETYVEGEVF